MYAYKKPLADTLVIEIDAEDAIMLHGMLLVRDSGEPLQADTLYSILEAFIAGTDMERFAPPSEDERNPYDVRETVFRNHAEEIEAAVTLNKKLIGSQCLSVHNSTNRCELSYAHVGQHKKGPHRWAF